MSCIISEMSKLSLSSRSVIKVSPPKSWLNITSYSSLYQWRLCICEMLYLIVNVFTRGDGTWNPINIGRPWHWQKRCDVNSNNLLILRSGQQPVCRTALPGREQFGRWCSWLPDRHLSPPGTERSPAHRWLLSWGKFQVIAKKQVRSCH